MWVWVWVLLGERECVCERVRERAVAPSTAPRDGAVKTRALRRGGGDGGGGSGDGGSGTSSPLRSKTYLPPTRFILSVLWVPQEVSQQLSQQVSVSLSLRGRAEWDGNCPPQTRHQNGRAYRYFGTPGSRSTVARA